MDRIGPNFNPKLQNIGMTNRSNEVGEPQHATAADTQEGGNPSGETRTVEVRWSRDSQGRLGYTVKHIDDGKYIIKEWDENGEYNEYPGGASYDGYVQDADGKFHIIPD